MAAERCIDTLDMHAYHDKTIELAATYARNMGLPEQCLDATLLTIRVEKGVPVAMIFGDGFLAVRKDGILRITKVSFPNNVPFYLNYKLNEKRRNCGQLQPAVVEELEFGPNGFATSHEALELPNDFLFKYVDAGSDFVAVMSDGAGSFLRPLVSETSKTNESVPQNEILPELLAFKTFQPGFVQRRLKRLEKDNRERGWQHYDDLSVGAIFLGEG